jgi:hypothetical protein
VSVATFRERKKLYYIFFFVQVTERGPAKRDLDEEKTLV